jgi:hypothetical protein
MPSTRRRFLQQIGAVGIASAAVIPGRAASPHSTVLDTRVISRDPRQMKDSPKAVLRQARWRMES